MFRIVALVLFCYFSIFVTLAGCSEEPGLADEREFTMGQIYWVPHLGASESAIVPKGVGLALEHSELILVQVPWSPDKDPINYVGWLAELANSHGRELAVALDWMDQERRSLLGSERSPWSFRSSESQERLIGTASDIVRRFSPKYMLLGVEVDFLARSSPAEFSAFVRAYKDAYDLIKKVDPQIDVLVSFQYEASLRDLPITKRFRHYGPVAAFGPKLDLLGLSLYPCQHFSSAERIPAGYLESVTSTSIPVGIFETAWPGDRLNLAEQEQYLAWLMRKGQTLRAPIVVWTSTTDLAEPLSSRRGWGAPPCHGFVGDWNSELGLWTRIGTPKPSVKVWKRWLSVPHYTSKEGEAATSDLTLH